MQIGNSMVIALSFSASVLHSDGDSEIIEQCSADEPFCYLYGDESLPPGVLAQLDGLEQGQSFDFQIDPDQGYGNFSQEAIVMLPKSVFAVNGTIDEELLIEGRMLPMYNEEQHLVYGRVLEIQEAQVLMDFNHPLVDQTLRFEGKIERVRPATAQELEHGHAHGADGHASHD